MAKLFYHSYAGLTTNSSSEVFVLLPHHNPEDYIKFYERYKSKVGYSDSFKLKFGFLTTWGDLRWNIIGTYQCRLRGFLSPSSYLTTHLKDRSPFYRDEMDFYFKRVPKRKTGIISTVNKNLPSGKLGKRWARKDIEYANDAWDELWRNYYKLNSILKVLGLPKMPKPDRYSDVDRYIKKYITTEGDLPIQLLTISQENHFTEFVEYFEELKAKVPYGFNYYES